MSGGHFEHEQYRIEEAAREVERIIRINDNTYPTDDNGYPIHREYHYPPDIIAHFKETALTLNRAAAMLTRVDYLLCGDDGEESFRERWVEEVEGLRDIFSTDPDDLNPAP